MGGELFLYWDKVEKIIIKIRQHFPNTKIGLATNGLLLPKYKDNVLTLCEKYHPCDIDITDHFTLFSKDVKAKKYHKKLDAFLSDFIPATVVKWDNPKEYLEKHKDCDIDDWKRFLIKEQTYAATASTIKVFNSQEFVPCYYTEEGKIKPWATNDPAGSYANGCAMPYCHTLVDSKLYKCSWFVVLPQLLSAHNQLQDPDWQPYLNYQPVDLINPTQEQLTQFEKTSRCAVPLCDMCTNNPNNILKQTKENVLP